MARLQILELPEGNDDDRPPFVLVIDEWANGEYVPHMNVIQQTGARGVLVFEETIDIPANDVPLDADGQPLFQEQIDRSIQAAAADLVSVLNRDAAHERTGIARDMDRLAKWKNELLDALGMDHTRDWDDIRNAAAGLRKQRDAQAAAVERVRNLHRPVEHDGTIICAECSGWDGSTTDNSPCGYEHCPTLKALTARQPATDA